ncbi:MAG: hypothetical protein GWP03_06295 [Proteobacteria bacterium]|nr:hypothetical protein [Pseudomonadota bacterium]
MGYSGQLTYTIDNDNRLLIPAKLRNHLFVDGEKGRVTITRGFDRNIILFNQSQWKAFEESLYKYPRKNDYRKIINWFIGSSETMDVDSQGRIKIPEFLLKEFDIKKHVVITKDKNALLLWDPDIYAEYIKTVRRDFEKIVDEMEMDF